MDKYTLIVISLCTVATILGGSVIASIIWPETPEPDVDIDVAIDIDGSFEDVND